MASRIRIACLLLAAAAGVAGVSRAAGPGDGPDPKNDPEFIAKVEASIARGVAYLLSKQAPSGKFPAFGDTRGEVYALGMHALATLAIMKGLGDPEAEPASKALRWIHTLYDREKERLKTYEAGLVLMVLDARLHTDPRPKVKGAGKPANKRRKRPRRKRARKLGEADLKLARELVVWLQRKQKPGGLWRYPENGMDLSNSQYAALGLWSAHRLGVAIQPGVITRMMDETLNRQQPKGKPVPFIPDPRLYLSKAGHRTTSTIEAKGWRYLPEERVVGANGKERLIRYPYSGSMTTAGIAILAIGRDILRSDKRNRWLTSARDAQVRKAMWEGLAWLQGNWDLYDNPGQPGNWPFYWIYGLERAARLCGVEYVGIYDWFHQGAVRLIDDQRPDGAWPKTQRMRPPGGQNVRWWSDQVDTCFAILFLTRSTPAIETPPPAITQRRE